MHTARALCADDAATVAALAEDDVAAAARAVLDAASSRVADETARAEAEARDASFAPGAARRGGRMRGGW